MISADRPVCGQPMRFYQLNRPRDDVFPVCCRPPHEGGRHMSRASVEHARQRSRDNRRRYDRDGHKTAAVAA